ncbi:hypothetical protein Halru_2676 [Halovivax ruber XH-70]|uniref:Uncharacterized protein n=1 Tax=Halovivax ruber (strain DSM 18193 / JCM 13892 / XH-70) TaxID=797302 RepID=L0IGZ6_HALRX|nr:hypothetical protein [Halovivax ruber]AGB17252.1 hypothetical protein Halru_2676 [Halovivax ruber XH-70]
MDATRDGEREPVEFVVSADGRLELRDPDRQGQWLSTDRPVEIVR